MQVFIDHLVWGVIAAVVLGWILISSITAVETLACAAIGIVLGSLTFVTTRWL